MLIARAAAVAAPHAARCTTSTRTSSSRTPTTHRPFVEGSGFGCAPGRGRGRSPRGAHLAATRPTRGAVARAADDSSGAPLDPNSEDLVSKQGLDVDDIEDVKRNGMDVDEMRRLLESDPVIQEAGAYTRSQCSST